MTSTYLVTGGAGFIGSNFVHGILNAYTDVKIVNVDALTYAGNLENLESVLDDPRHIFAHADIRDRHAMDALFALHKPDYVVNFAAESHVDRSIENPSVFTETNVSGTVSLLDAARCHWQDGDGWGMHRFLQVSTDEVYGSLPLEDSSVLFNEKTPLNPHSPYSASKAAADLLVQAYGDTYGMPVCITRCSNNYGPYQFPEKLVPLVINNALNHRKLPVYGDGLNVRDWLYVEDHCRAIDLVLREGRSGEVYNIGGNNERANIELVKTIVEYLSRHTDAAISTELIEYVTDRQGHDRRYGIDASKIKQELGWEPRVGFDEGIKLTIRWYLDHVTWITHAVSGEYESYYEKKYGNEVNV
ncbi:MAG: dTDP-glucose 4,6-dehydratase [Gordonibacter sp.]|uniref:dTDP-glucose 4,6-dehydratase n=1 Tax=Gordonibacter sp. TaxID=1968902 RepID=UPI002FC9601B